MSQHEGQHDDEEWERLRRLFQQYMEEVRTHHEFIKIVGGVDDEAKRIMHEVELGCAWLYRHCVTDPAGFDQAA
ncbi:hypothetical protein [Streptomyces sp. NBC_00620]|uniref:hypothetical protein n=1 Tax=Streptomyces sp. NBC_00620 TaxID=2903666 RepID=UPI00225A401E|nr:hypothetical protein [Streptomyces sp. NBC_00620]MCX4976238.1 hypothetical protein [Streptomyces sp. NBC_00620]